MLNGSFFAQNKNLYVKKTFFRWETGTSYVEYVNFSTCNKALPIIIWMNTGARLDNSVGAKA